MKLHSRPIKRGSWFFSPGPGMPIILAWSSSKRLLFPVLMSYLVLIMGCTVEFSPGDAICGNGVLEGDEMCDREDFGGKTCRDWSSYEHGWLVCTEDCKVDFSFCHTCGNGKVEGPEDCDGDNLSGETCESLGGEPGGTLACRANCRFDLTGCQGICGNNIAEEEEACDGTDLAGETCESLGYEGGNLACLDDCSGFDTSGCGGPEPLCGNNIAEEGEVCDGTDLAGETCESLGYEGGNLACLDDCSGFDTNGCWKCGDGVCDSHLGENHSNCPEDCPDLGTIQPSAYIAWMEPRYFINGTGVQTVDCSERFDGDYLVYSIVGSAPSGVTINSSTGELSVPTGSDFDWTTITIRGSNSLGHAEVTLDLRVLTPTYVLTDGAPLSTVPSTSRARVVIRASTYAPTSPINISGWSGTSDAPNEIMAYPGETVTFSGANLGGSRVLTLGSASWLTLRGLHFVDNGTTDFAFYGNTASNIHIAQCFFRDFKRGAFSGGWENREVPRPWTIEYCRSWNNTRENRNPDGTGGALGTTEWGCGLFGDLIDGTVIRRNWVWENWGCGILIIGLDNGLIEENYIWDNYSANIAVDNGANVTVTKNYVFGTNPLFFRDGNPANSVLLYNFYYGEDSPYHLAGENLVVNYNFIHQDLPPPYYWEEGGGPPGPGPGFVITPNTILSTEEVDERWKTAAFVDL